VLTAVAKDGSLYGTTYFGGAYGGSCDNCDFVFTYGTVFKITTDGQETTLWSFGSPYIIHLFGSNPQAGLVQGRDGNFYGTTGSPYPELRPAGPSALFGMSPSGAMFPVIMDFGGNLGSDPHAALVQGCDGDLYGTTSQGGAGGAGTVFRFSFAPAFQGLVLTNASLSLTWFTLLGKTYQLQASSDLKSNWSNLGGPVSPSAAQLTFTDPLTNGPQRFYRLLALP
jgi:uncharacterized repeat protein (TIGR03803 family)